MISSKSITSLLLLALTTHASLLQKRAGNATDVQILQYALTLEHLESAFYTEALAKFDQKAFSDAGLNRSLFEEIASHETSHVAFLSTALGDQATKACNYSFPYSDLKGFTALSMVLEGVGVSAYLGAAAEITNKVYSTAASSILTTEARHAAYVSSVSTTDKTPWSGGFDTPLDLHKVYSLAAPFITSCPSTNPALPVKSFPTLNLTTNNYTAGSNLSVAFAENATTTGANNNNSQLHLAFLTGLNAIYALYDPKSKSTVIPENLTGTVYVVLTNSTTTNGTSTGIPTDETTLAGPAVLMLADNMTAASASGSPKTAKKSDALSENKRILFGWSIVIALFTGLVASTF